MRSAGRWRSSRTDTSGNAKFDRCSALRPEGSISVALLLARRPVHFPVAEQPLPQRPHVGMVQRQFLLQHDLSHVGRIDREPAGVFQEHLSAAMLRFTEVATFAKLRKQMRVGDPDAVHVARRKAGRAREANHQAVDVGALTPDFSRFQHRFDIAIAAAGRVRIRATSCLRAQS